MKNQNIINIINRVKESNWVEKDPVNVSLSHASNDSDKKIFRKVSFGRGQELEVILNEKRYLIKNICYCEEDDELYAEVFIRTVYYENRIIPFSEFKDKHIVMIAEKLLNPIMPDSSSFIIGYILSNFMLKKYEVYKNRVKCIRFNFIFLNDGSFIYDYDKFDDHIQAMIDASNHGENLKELISFIYPEESDQDSIYQNCLKRV